MFSLLTRLAIQASEKTGPKTQHITILITCFALITLIALIDLRRHPARLCLGGKRWPWAIVIIVLFGFGWSLYLLFGRLNEKDLAEAEKDEE